ncbi:MAG: hypothetical protein AAGF95_13435 [Chloroflexota bacterium]
MKDRLCIIGLDELAYEDIRAQVFMPVVGYEVVPPMMVHNGQLLVASRTRSGMLPVSRVVFHGIFENDFNCITALALWGGPCLPNAHGMMDCRLRFPCLVRALQHTQFGDPLRGYIMAGVLFTVESDHVAKWGNWHCGENKARFTGAWESTHDATIEPFLDGQSVRVVLIGDKHWQIKLEGSDWLKSIHDSQAALMPVDAELLADTRRVSKALRLETIANDYIVTADGSKHLLEVNHIPNVTRFPEIWHAYKAHVVRWVTGEC